VAIPYSWAAVVAATLPLLCGQAQAPSLAGSKGAQYALWLNIKRMLTGPDGMEYFESAMKGTLLPALRGTVLTAGGSESTGQFVLNLSGDSAPEVTLLVRRSQNQYLPERGSEIEFSGVPVGFTPQPFMLTIRTEEDEARVVPGACGEGPLAGSYFGPALGIVKDGRYRHNGILVRFDVPPGWCVQGTQPSQDGGEIAVLVNSNFPRVYAAVWMVRDKIPFAQIATRLQAAIPEVVGKRAGFEGYAIRPGSVESLWIGGRKALRAAADYEVNGQPMSETLTWIYTERTRVLFFARGRALEIPAFQTRFDQIIYSAVVP
jgi:hypothetical protein